MRHIAQERLFTMGFGGVLVETYKPTLEELYEGGLHPLQLLEGEVTFQEVLDYEMLQCCEEVVNTLGL